MDETVVFVKTPKGAAEVAARGGALSLATRRVLIMIDGKRSVRELAPLLRPTEVDGVFAALESQGFVQRVGGRGAELPAAPRPAARGDMAGPLLDVPTIGGDNDERNLITFDEAKRRAVRELVDRLGPDADGMAARIEQCRNADDLRDRMREAERLIGGLMGEAAAQDYVRALRRR